MSFEWPPTRIFYRYIGFGRVETPSGDVSKQNSGQRTKDGILCQGIFAAMGTNGNRRKYEQRSENADRLRGD